MESGLLVMELDCFKKATILTAFIMHFVQLFYTQSNTFVLNTAKTRTNGFVIVLISEIVSVPAICDTQQSPHAHNKFII